MAPEDDHRYMHDLVRNKGNRLEKLLEATVWLVVVTTLLAEAWHLCTVFPLLQVNKIDSL